MIRHIVWWTLKPEAEGRSAAEKALLIKQRLEALRDQIPGLVSIDVALDFLESSTLPVQVLLTSVHENAEALKVYASHPKHVAIGQELVSRVTSSRQAIDAVFEPSSR